MEFYTLLFILLKHHATHNKCPCFKNRFVRHFKLAHTKLNMSAKIEHTSENDKNFLQTNNSKSKESKKVIKRQKYNGSSVDINEHFKIEKQIKLQVKFKYNTKQFLDFIKKFYKQKCMHEMGRHIED